MAPLKAGFFVVAALGSTFAVREVTSNYIVPTFFAGPPDATQQTAPAHASPASPTPPPAQQGGASESPNPKSAIKELSNEEMEAELKRAQEAIATGRAPKGGKFEEYSPSKPLPADLAVGLPSDI